MKSHEEITHRLKIALEILKPLVKDEKLAEAMSSIEYMDFVHLVSQVESTEYHWFMSRQDLRSQDVVKECCDKCQQ